MAQQGDPPSVGLAGLLYCWEAGEQWVHLASSSSPARPHTDELTGTSSVEVGGDPASPPFAPVAIHTEQEKTQQEPGEAVPRIFTFNQTMNATLRDHDNAQRRRPTALRTLQATRGQHYNNDPGECLMGLPNQDCTSS